MRGFVLILFFVLFAAGFLPAQEVLNKTLLKADKHYIEHRYTEAVIDYVKYLEKYPKDYYASRQTAICYNRLNDPNNAIDYEPGKNGIRAGYAICITRYFKKYC
jgi:hypothetical protein